MTAPKITIARKSGLAALTKRLAGLSKLAAYVGVPADKSSRKGDPINNAELLFIFSKGSPMRHQPPRPVIEPAIESKGEAIGAEIVGSVKASLAGDKPLAEKKMMRAALAGQSAARGYFTSGQTGWPELADSTKAARLQKMKGVTKKKAKAMIAAGEDPFTIGVDSGAMRAAIIGIVKEE